MGGVALHGLHQVGDEVVSTLQLRVYGLPGVVAAVVLGDDAVVDRDEPHAKYDDEGNDEDDESHVRSLLCGAGPMPARNVRVAKLGRSIPVRARRILARRMA